MPSNSNQSGGMNRQGAARRFDRCQISLSLLVINGKVRQKQWLASLNSCLEACMLMRFIPGIINAARIT